jgi:putative peptidoglycan lipid II flippase
LATFLIQGSVSYLYYAFRLIHLPIGMVGVAMATAVLPTMAAAAARHSPEDVMKTLVFALRVSLFATIPALLGLAIYRHTIIHLLFERGEFTAAATAATAQVLLGYCLGLCFFVANRILARAFYAFQDTVTPVKAGAIAVASNIVFSLLLMYPLQAAGLAVATSLASVVNFSALMLLLRKHLGGFPRQVIVKSLRKTGFAALCMAGTLIALQGLLPSLEGRGVFLELTRFLGELGLGTGVYLAVAAFLGCDEVQPLRGLFRR